MRTKNEIKQAVAILTHKADRLSLVQAEVLQGGMTEQQAHRYLEKKAMDTRKTRGTVAMEVLACYEP